MVGRDRELRSLRDALSRAAADRSCQLFTVLGSAGVGKSRLAAEFLAGVEAKVVRGRCLSYGDGITYWPVVEVIKQLRMLPDDADAAEPLRSLLGETASSATAEEIAWSFRKLLEQEARPVPLVCVFDDMHWAEPTFLALVESVAELSRDAPLLLLCMARPELLELRPSWGGGMWNATTVLLEPLDAAETAELLEALGGVDEDLSMRIAANADGNPLFVEEMLALVRSSPDGRVEVPPTIQALLAARLDQLDAGERAVLERGSIEGQVFHRGSVEALANGEPQADRLTALVRKQLVRPDRPQLPNEDAYRFRHLLIRDAAYDALPKSIRADLHRRFARWLETHGQDLVELEEITGYHYEQAARYLAELGRPDKDLAAAAAERLWRAGRRAQDRGDRGAAHSLLDRAIAQSEHPATHLLVDRARSVTARDAVPLLDAAAEHAAAEGDAAGAALARAIGAFNRTLLSGISADEQERLALAAIPLLEAAGDDHGLIEVWASLADGVYNLRGDFARMEYAAEEALRYAARAGEQQTPGALSLALIFGPRPVAEALARVTELAQKNPHPQFLADRTILHAMRGDVDEARTLLERSVALARERGRPELGDVIAADVEEIAGNHEAAAEHLAAYCAVIEERGLAPVLSTYAPRRGRHLCALGQFDAAERLAEQGRELGHDDDPVTQSLWRQVMALVLANRGDHSGAERLAREAVSFVQATGSPWQQGDALCDLAEVLEAAGRDEEAATALHDALIQFELKGMAPSAKRVQERLALLSAAQ